MRWLIAALLLLFAAAPAAADKRIALTFDDVPRGRGAFFTPDQRTIRLIAGLHKAGVKQAAFYIVPGQIGHDDGIGGEQRIEAYVAAGHVIADHSFAHQLALKTWHRQPAQVIVLHETDIAALFIPDLVAALRKDGWKIVTADEAYADPISRLAPNVPSANGSLLELAAWEKGIPKPRWYARNDIDFANRLYADRVLHEMAPAK